MTDSKSGSRQQPEPRDPKPLKEDRSFGRPPKTVPTKPPPSKDGK